MKIKPLSRNTRTVVIAIAVVAVAVAAAIGVTAFLKERQTTVGLITKIESNPFFVKVREGALSSARAKNVRLLSAAGKFEGDYQSQIAAIEDMVSQGATTILITPNDSKAVVPAIQKAREKGVQVIALDSPTDPATAVDALFATDNYKAGQLIGEYAKGALGSVPPVIATLDLFPGHPVGVLRHNGFLSGFGLAAPAPDSLELGKADKVVCMGDSYGEQKRGREAMVKCLSEHPDINLVYTINEPAAAGAYEAIAAAGKENQIMIVSIDGGCAGVKDVQRGAISATSQQYPNNMAILGVAAGDEYARTGKRASGYVDTGVTLIADKEVRNVVSRGTSFGMTACW